MGQPGAHGRGRADHQLAAGLHPRDGDRGAAHGPAPREMGTKPSDVWIFGALIRINGRQVLQAAL